MMADERTAADGPQKILDRIDFDNCLEESRAQVWSLLQYAMADANKDITADRPDLIEKVLPGLKKRPAEMSEADIANLFTAYNELSQLVYPATVESLWLKRQIEVHERSSVLDGSADATWLGSMLRRLFVCKASEAVNGQNPQHQQRKTAGQQVQKNTGILKWLLYIWGAIFIVLQAYTLVLSFKLEVVEQKKIELEALDREMASTKAAFASQGKTVDDEVKKKYPLNEQYLKRASIIHSLNDIFCVLHKPEFLWGTINHESDIDCASARDTTESAKDKQTNAEPAKDIPTNSSSPYDEENPQAVATRDTFFACAAAVQRVLNYLLLPPLLGLLGALAFVIRDLLKNYAQASYVIGSRRNRSMRIVLGPLLGLISGIIAYPSREAFTAAAFSPLIFGFLMGYSVEFAFSLFDSLIEKGKSLLPDVIIPPKQPTGSTAQGAEVPQIFKLEPAQGPENGGNSVVISGKGFGKDAKVNFGSNAANVEKIEGSQVAVTAPPGTGTVNVVVQTAGGTSLSRAESLYTYVSGTVDDLAEDEGHACDAEVQGQALTPDDELPAAQGGVDERGA